MKTQKSATQKYMTWILLAAALCAIVIALLIINKQEKTNTTAFNDSTDTVFFEVDHKTYSGAAELREDSDVVVLGSVLDDGSTWQDKPVGTSDDGQPAPGLVNTEFSVRVDNSLKGSIEKDVMIRVVLTGGVINDTRYAAEDMPWLHKGDRVIIYLSAGDDGKYYPMAGGAAIAHEQDDESGKFVLPGEVSGHREIKVSEAKF